ncbi:MAG TPA: redoxin domain-containing protein [Nitrospirota bacterium]
MLIKEMFCTAIIAVTAATLFCVSSAGSATAIAFRNVEPGQTPPDFTLKDTAGRDVSLSAKGGSVVVVAFVKPDQDASQKAMADLQKIQDKFGKRGVSVLAVVSEMGEQAQLKDVVEKNKITYPILLDDGRKVYGQWGAFLYPTTGVIDKTGKMILHVPSHNRKYQETLEGNIRLALGEINQEQLNAALNPVEKEKLTEGQKEASRRMLLAQRLIERKQYDKAAEELSKAVEADPESCPARVKYGFILLKLGDAVKAKESFTKAVELNPKDNDARAGLGASMVAAGDIDKGIETISESLKSNPRPARSHLELGRAYEKKGDTVKALEFYKKALEELCESL